MSKIPYFFDTPVPKYFRETGWFDNENTFKFVNWAFARCSTQAHKVVVGSKEITLAPFEFIAGRLTSPKECFLTEKQFRGQLNSLLDADLLKKGANSRANRFTTYIWVTERFCRIEGQQKGQQRANRGPTKGHDQEDQKIRSKEDHPSIPSFKKQGKKNGLIDDLFSKEEQKEKIHVHLACYLTKDELDECIKIRGSLERVKDVIAQVVNWPGRKHEIKDWPKTIKDWKFKNVVADRAAENEKLGKTIEELYGESQGWSARIYRDTLKDQRGILFEGQGAYMTPIFVSFTEFNFKEKCQETIKSKQMKKRI
jgi:hypothetical protein